MRPVRPAASMRSSASFFCSIESVSVSTSHPKVCAACGSNALGYLGPIIRSRGVRTSMASPPQPLPNSRMRCPGWTRAVRRTWWILRFCAASRSPGVGPISRSPRTPPSASLQRPHEYIISLLRNAWRNLISAIDSRDKMWCTYLKEFIGLVVAGDRVEARL